ncbi:MAG: hypothetical protein MJ067_00975 [Oscillospiraceae bacterium]|nr:hypothetical protein [Oscillospiraceae bacterium]
MNNYLEMLNNLDDKLIDEAACYVPEKKPDAGTKIFSFVAVFTLIIIAILVASQFLIVKMKGALPFGASNIIISENSVSLRPMSSEVRNYTKLLSKGPVYISIGRPYSITQGDLGNEMGIVSDSADKSLIGLSAYYYSKMPDVSSVCIIEMDGEYKFYSATDFRITLGPNEYLVIFGENEPSPSVSFEKNPALPYC